MHASCPHCGKSGKVAQALVGKSIRCPSCRKSFLLSDRDATSSADLDPSGTTRRISVRTRVIAGACVLVLLLLSAVPIVLLVVRRTAAANRASAEQVSAMTGTTSKRDARPELRPELTPAPEPVTLSVDQLFAEFCQDAAAADRKYRNKPIRLTGVSGRVATDAVGRPFIAACLQGRKKVSNRATPQSGAGSDVSAAAPGVVIYFQNKTVAAPARRDPAQAMTIRGLCAGSTPDASTSPAFFVVVEYALAE